MAVTKKEIVIAIVLSLLFNIFFRGYTGFFLSDLINITTVIFSLLILGTLAGPAFYLFHHDIKKSGTLVFQLLSILITIALIIAGFQVQKSTDIVVAKEFSELLAGVTIITGLCISFGIPFLYLHDYI